MKTHKVIDVNAMRDGDIESNVQFEGTLEQCEKWIGSAIGYFILPIIIDKSQSKPV